MSTRDIPDQLMNTDSPTLGPSGYKHTETQSLKTVRDDGSTLFTDIGRPWQVPLYISENDSGAVQPRQTRFSDMTTSTQFTDLQECPDQGPVPSAEPGTMSAGTTTGPSTVHTADTHRNETSSWRKSVLIQLGAFYDDASSEENESEDEDGKGPTHTSQTPSQDPFHIPYNIHRMSALNTDFTATPTGRATVADSVDTTYTRSSGSRAFLSLLCCGKLPARARRNHARTDSSTVGLEPVDIPRRPVSLPSNPSESAAPDLTYPVDDGISRVDFGQLRETSDDPLAINTAHSDKVLTREDPRLSLFPLPPGYAS